MFFGLGENPQDLGRKKKEKEKKIHRGQKWVGWDE